jgi:hypothetical protein
MGLDRRSVARKDGGDEGALLFFKGQIGVHSCNIIDLSTRGVKVQTHHLPVLPIIFELTFDNFATVHHCRLIWRKGHLVGAAFKN